MVAAFLLAYVVLDWVSYLYPVSPLAITVWNPPPGLALALLLLFGLEFAPAVFAAALVADIVVRGAPGPIWFAVGSALVIAAGYTLVAALLLKATLFTPFVSSKPAGTAFHVALPVDEAGGTSHESA